MPEEKFSTSDDALLLRNLAAEDSRLSRMSFEAIYDRYSTKLLRYVSSKVQAKVLSEDIVQEIFISLWTRRQNIRIKNDSLEHYLFQAARNQVFTYFRSENVKKRYNESFTIFLMSRMEDSTNDWMNLNETRELVEAILNKLPDRCQIAFRLSRFENHPIPEIARQMNISSRTVENYLTRALKEMRLVMSSMDS